MQEKRIIHSVDSPFGPWPDFSFDHEPTIREMRERAVLIMHRALSVQWFTEKTITATTSVAAKTFEPYEKYAGLPYTGPNTSIFGFLQFLDEETGRLKTEELEQYGYPDLSVALNRLTGSSCSGTAGWAIAAVCNSVHGLFQCYYMVPKNGWLKLGPYEYDTSIDLFGKDSSLSTDEICRQNGREKMYESYQLLQPADIVVWQDRKLLGHTMMAIGEPVLNYREDGSLNDERSYVFVQDQRAGGFQNVDERTGACYKYMGRVNCKYTFKMLYDEGYIPATTAEFQGLKPYEKAWVKLSGPAPESIAEARECRILSNYPIAHVKWVGKDRDGGSFIPAQYALNRRDVAEGIAFDYPLKNLTPSLERLKPGSYKFTLIVTLPSGERFTPIQFSEDL